MRGLPGCSCGQASVRGSACEAGKGNVAENRSDAYETGADVRCRRQNEGRDNRVRYRHREGRFRRRRRGRQRERTREMRIHFTNPLFLLLLLALPGIVWLSWKSLADLGTWRKWTSLAMRLVILLALILGLSGTQILRPTDSLSVFYLLDRSESIPASY